MSDFTVDLVPKANAPFLVAGYLLGKPVFSVAAGEKMGRIRDIYFDSDLSQMVAISLGDRGVINKKALVIPLDKIVVIGRDIALVQSAENLTPITEKDRPKEWIGWNALRGRTVMAHGISVAVVEDVYLNEGLVVNGFTFAHVIKGCILKPMKRVPPSIVIKTGGATGQKIQVDLDRV